MNATTLERKSGNEIVITRTFGVPARILFEAWTNPDLVRRWWAPKSRGVTVVECTADVRPGGAYRYVLGRGGERMAFFGTYRAVEPATRLVYTQSFEPVIGHPLPGEAVVTLAFTERAGETTLVAHEVYPSKEVLDGVLASGMEEGMRETYELLDALVASLPRA